MRKSKVHVTAFIAGNLGDDLFLKVLCDRYSDVEFVTVGPKKYKHYFNEIPNLRYIIDDSLLLKLLYKPYSLVCDMLGLKKYYRNVIMKNLLAYRHKVNVLISGSMFTETEYRLKELEMERSWYNQKPILIGCSFGPFVHEEYYDRFKEEFSKATSICFRDHYSYNLFSSLGHVTYAPDVVFNLEWKTSDEGYYVFSILNLETADFGNWKAYAASYNRKIIEMVNLLTSQKKKVVLVSFCTSLGDLEAINIIYDQCNLKEYVKVCDYSEVGMNYVLDLFAHAHGIVATRFHALVLAVAFKKRVFPIIYSNKMSNMLTDFDVENGHYDIDKFVEKDIDEVFHDFIDASQLKVDEVKEMSKKQFEVLDNTLNLKEDSGEMVNLMS